MALSDLVCQSCGNSVQQSQCCGCRKKIHSYKCQKCGNMIPNPEYGKTHGT